MPVSKTEVWIDWALQKAERLPGVGKHVADYRQERVWNNPAAVADHDEWMAKAVADNDRMDRINGDLPAGEPDWEALTEKLNADRTHTETFGRDDQNRLHRDPREGPAQITFTESFGGDFYDRTELYVVHGELLARAEFESGQDEEGSWYRETWFDREDNKHSFNGNPAEIRRSNHYIPEETYLDESVVEFSHHGTFVDSIDRTYEDIVSHKPLAVRQAFGYDIDGPDVPTADNALPQFAGRFDEPRPVLPDEDREWMTPQDWREACQYSGNDYAEAYGDIAGDATLSWRLEKEDPRDILNDVRREASLRAGLLEPEAKHTASGTISDPDQRDLFITALTASLGGHGYTVKEFGLEQDTAPEHGIGR